MKPTQAELLRFAASIGVKPCNAVGTKEHQKKWVGKLMRFGFSRSIAKNVYDDALAHRWLYTNFGESVKAYAGAAHGILTAPKPGGDWNQ